MRDTPVKTSKAPKKPQKSPPKKSSQTKKPSSSQAPSRTTRSAHNLPGTLPPLPKIDKAGITTHGLAIALGLNYRTILRAAKRASISLGRGPLPHVFTLTEAKAVYGMIHF